MRLPQHVAIIMDGNGRWAQQKGFGRTWGHHEGVRRVDDILTACCQIGIPYLTLYAFSTENWNRPRIEVTLLMHLLVDQLRRLDKKMVRNRVAFHAQGNLEKLPKIVQTEIKRVAKVTSVYEPKLRLGLCLSYGGRQEIVDACKKIIKDCSTGKMNAETLTEEDISKSLYLPFFPEPDLLIRTGGESRVSNFLLWQIAYSEIIVSDILWPDFYPENFIEVIKQFNSRERRFGLTGEQIKQQATL